jgi:hypothetical protein
MANLTPTPDENADVFQWDGVTPLLGGGPTAPLNRQAQALLNMIAWLKERAQDLADAIPDPAASKNKIINGTFAINQAEFAGGALSAGSFGHDRWRAGAGGANYFVSGEVATINSGTLRQVISGVNVMEGGTYTLSWSGTAQGRVDSGAYAPSPITVSGKTAGANTVVEFGAGTLSQVKYEHGSVATPFERRLYSVELDACMDYYIDSRTVGNALFNANCSSGSAYAIVKELPRVMIAVPTVSVTEVYSFGFPAGATTVVAGRGFIKFAKTANSSQLPGYYELAWSARAEP